MTSFKTELRRQAAAVTLPSDLAEELPHALEPRALAGIVALSVVAKRGLELAQQALLLGIQFDGRFDHNPAEQVARRPATYRLDALLPQPENAAGLRAVIDDLPLGRLALLLGSGELGGAHLQDGFNGGAAHDVDAIVERASKIRVGAARPVTRTVSSSRQTNLSPARRTVASAAMIDVA